MEITKYPDGTSYVTIGSEDDLEPILFRVNTYEDLHHLEQFVDAFNYKHGTIPTILIPNLIDAQADRRFANNQSSGLKIICKRLNSIKAKFMIFHPHNPEVVEALIDNVIIIDNSKFIFEVIYGNIFKNKSKSAVEQENNLILMSSDAGGFKPLMKLCDKLKWEGETAMAGKSRNYTAGKSNLIQVLDRQDFGGKDVLIIDDLCVYGGTFKGLAKLLRERNVGKLYLAVSHMTIQNHKDDELFKLYDKVFVTNSKYDNYYVPNRDNTGGYQPSNLKVIKMF